MKIKWYGHACFEVVSGNYSVVIDPYGYNSVPGLSLPRIDANKVLCTHTHEDHNNKKAVRIIKNGNCPFRFATVKTYHDDEMGAKRGNNSIFILESEGLRVAHFGDLGCTPDDEQLEMLRGLDVAMIPVGSYYTIGAELAHEILQKLGDVKVIIPMHYRGEGFGYGVLDTVDRFLDLVDDRECYEYGSEIEIDKDTERHVAVMTL